MITRIDMRTGAQKKIAKRKADRLWRRKMKVFVPAMIALNESMKKLAEGLSKRFEVRHPNKMPYVVLK